MPEYSDIVKRFISGYKKLFPKHLNDDAQRMCQGFFVGFYDVILRYCINKGILQLPPEGSVCDVLIQYK